MLGEKCSTYINQLETVTTCFRTTDWVESGTAGCSCQSHLDPCDVSIGSSSESPVWFRCTFPELPRAGHSEGRWVEYGGISALPDDVTIGHRIPQPHWCTLRGPEGAHPLPNDHKYLPRWTGGCENWAPSSRPTDHSLLNSTYFFSLADSAPLPTAQPFVLVTPEPQGR